MLVASWHGRPYGAVARRFPARCRYGQSWLRPTPLRVAILAHMVRKVLGRRPPNNDASSVPARSIEATYLDQ
jgi:hypothetical protein